MPSRGLSGLFAAHRASASVAAARAPSASTTTKAFSRHEERLQQLSMRPSEYVRRQMRFTPYPTEDVGWIVDQAGPEVALFSSDYEGPTGIIGVLSAALGGAGIETLPQVPWRTCRQRRHDPAMAVLFRLDYRWSWSTLIQARILDHEDALEQLHYHEEADAERTEQDVPVVRAPQGLQDFPGID